MNRICVLGLGYIGLPTAVMFASTGYEVIGVDVKEEVLRSLRSGDCHIDEPGLSDLVRQVILDGKLKVSPHPVRSDAFIIAVPTPITGQETRVKRQESRDESQGGEGTLDSGLSTLDYPHSDLSYVKSAAASITPVLKRGDLIVLESTSPPGTTEEILVPILEDGSGLKAGEDFHVAYCPERVLPGKILQEIVHNARIIGGINRESTERARELYSGFVRGEMHPTDARTAEMVKLAENTFRDVNIALANELSRICHALDMDVWQVIELANLHPRVNILKPGPGVGGHCIAVDPWFIVEGAPREAKLIKAAREVNDSQPEYVFERIKELIRGIENPKIAVLGIAYKGNVGDTRESPALKVIDLLKAEGYEVAIYDPYVEGYDSAEGVFEGSDCVAVLVDHSRFREIAPEKISSVVRSRLAFDAKAVLDRERWRQAGFKVETI